MKISIRAAIGIATNKDGTESKRARCDAIIESFDADRVDIAMIPLLLEIRDAVRAKVADINVRLTGTPYPDGGEVDLNGLPYFSSNRV